MANDKAKSILLVDDDPEVLELIRDLLECEGHRCILAPDGQVGSIKTKNESFDLIISDLNMPKQNGIKFLNNIAKNRSQGTKLTPMILITGEVTPIATEICSKAQIPILEKPFTPDQLIDLVNEKLEHLVEQKEKSSNSQDDKNNFSDGDLIFSTGDNLKSLFL